MSLPSKPAAYRDCYELFDLALATPGGVRAPCPTENRAKHFQARMNKARVIERDLNSRIYGKNHRLYDTSPWDGYTVRVLGPDPAGEWWVYVEDASDPSIVENFEPIDVTLIPGHPAAKALAAATTVPRLTDLTQDPPDAKPSLPSTSEPDGLD